MKSFMQTNEFLLFFKNKFPEYAQYAKNGFIDKSKEKGIGIYLGVARDKQTIALGGLKCTETYTLPLNISIRWTESTVDCDTVANNIFTALFGLSNVIFGNRRIAGISLLDPVPVDIGRDEKNICQTVIRINVTYDLEEVI
jgi:hypothetical protein